MLNKLRVFLFCFAFASNCIGSAGPANVVHIELYFLDKDCRIYLTNAESEFDIKYEGNFRYDYVQVNEFAGRIYIVNEGLIRYKKNTIKMGKEKVVVNGKEFMAGCYRMVIDEDGTVTKGAFYFQ